jgi:type IV pilus assembly protein PilQ
VSSNKTGEVVVLYDDKQDEEFYDLKSQMKIDQYTGKAKGLDVHYGGITKRYTGEKIALDFYETDIKNVFRILKEISGQNFAIDKDVNGKVTLSFDKPVPWDQVLDLVLKMNQLGRIYEGDIIRIATKATLKEEEKQKKERLAQRQSAKNLEDLITIFIPVSYTSSKDMVDQHIKKIITKRGNISHDERLNMVIITDVPDVIKRAKEIIQKLDKVTPQVLIEARIVEVSSSFSNEIGVDWGGTMGPWDSAGLDGTLIGNVAMNYPFTATTSGLGFVFNRLAGTPLVLNAQLTAMETRGEGKIISAPKILTVDGKKATIKQGYEVPYQEESSSGGTTTKFKPVDLLLEVTPMVTPDGRVLMEIHIEKNDVLPSSPGEAPAISTNEAQTELLVNDGDTIVIGGIIKSNVSNSDSGWPGLKNIPLLGWLFKTKTKSEASSELLIFITPTIVQLEQQRLVD